MTFKGDGDALTAFSGATCMVPWQSICPPSSHVMYLTGLSTAPIAVCGVGSMSGLREFCMRAVCPEEAIDLSSGDVIAWPTKEYSGTYYCKEDLHIGAGEHPNADAAVDNGRLIVSFMDCLPCPVRVNEFAAMLIVGFIDLRTNTHDNSTSGPPKSVSGTVVAGGAVSSISTLVVSFSPILTYS